MSDHLSHRGLSPEGPPRRPCGPPGPRRAGSTVLFGLAPGGVCLAAASPRRRCALTAPFHLCLYAAHVWPRHRPCVSVALSRGFPRVGVTHRPRPVESGLSSRGFLSPRGRSARKSMVARKRPTATLQGRDETRPCGEHRPRGRGSRRRLCGSAPLPRSPAAAGCGRPRGRSASRWPRRRSEPRRSPRHRPPPRDE